MADETKAPYVPEVSDVVTEDIEVVFDSATKAQREQAQQIIADYIAKNIQMCIRDRVSAVRQPLQPRPSAIRQRRPALCQHLCPTYWLIW